MVTVGKIALIFLISILTLLFVLLIMSQISKEKLKNELRKSEDEVDKLRNTVMQNDRYYLSVMHDMKNLIFPFVAYSELLAMENISFEKMKSIVQKMNQSIDGLIDIFTNALEINKKKSKFLISSPTLWNLHDQINEIQTLLLAPFSKKSISFENHIMPDQTVYADYEIIRSVLVNLLINAIKFTPNGGKIMAYGEKIEENLYKISIKDNGIGIDEKKKDELLSPRYRISTNGTAGEVGTGFGLAICKDFVQMQGGDVDVKNNHGEAGATFSFTIPIT